MPTQPSLRVAKIRTHVFDKTPETPRMILFLQVHQLVQNDVVADRRRHLNEPIVQSDSSGLRARSPTRSLVANGKTRDDEAVFSREFIQARANFFPRERAQIDLDTTTNTVTVSREQRTIGVLNRPPILRVVPYAEADQLTPQHHRRAVDP